MEVKRTQNRINTTERTQIHVTFHAVENDMKTATGGEAKRFRKCCGKTAVMVMGFKV